MRKGVLDLSTNAIVTIIIAAVVLLLFVIFITVGFGTTSERFMEQTRGYGSARTASAEEPLLAQEPESAGPGEQFRVRASVFNKGPDAQDVSLVLTCPSGLLDGALQASTRDIPARSAAAYVAIGRYAANAPQGQSVCIVRAITQGGAGSALAESDLVLTVA